MINEKQAVNVLIKFISLIIRTSGGLICRR
jgi:hypothetical protein